MKMMFWFCLSVLFGADVDVEADGFEAVVDDFGADDALSPDDASVAKARLATTRPETFRY